MNNYFYHKNWIKFAQFLLSGSLGMISRRLLRIKTLQALYAHYKSEGKTISQSEKDLFFSIEKTYDLYYLLHLLIIDIRDAAIKKIELAKHKQIPEHDDLYPNIRFIENKLILQFQENYRLHKYINNRKLSWVNYPELVKNLLSMLVGSEEYKTYMEAENNDYEADKNIIIDFLACYVADYDDLHQAIEEQSIFWNDDIEFIASMLIKTIKKYRSNQKYNGPVFELYKKEEDRKFVKDLFRKSILKETDYRNLIDKYTINWEIDRIAFMDILVMQLAISEMIGFPEIPVKVSLNEYLEIAKFYCTERSSNFINGILDKIVHDLRRDKVIIKRGKGLIGDNSIN